MVSVFITLLLSFSIFYGALMSCGRADPGQLIPRGSKQRELSFDTQSHQPLPRPRLPISPCTCSPGHYPPARDNPRARLQTTRGHPSSPETNPKVPITSPFHPVRGHGPVLQAALSCLHNRGDGTPTLALWGALGGTTNSLQTVVLFADSSEHTSLTVRLGGAQSVLLQGS